MTLRSRKWSTTISTLLEPSGTQLASAEDINGAAIETLVLQSGSRLIDRSLAPRPALFV
jgi:hypothetical protein